MLCILAFIIFLILFPILGFFPEYRRLFRRSWECVFKKITLQPCDINLGDELKNKAIAKLFKIHPGVAKFFDKTFSFWAILFVIINIWSLITVALAGLNLFVYDTCDPATGESCSLSGEACGVGSTQISIGQAIREDRIGEWITQPWTELGNTLSLVPSRIRSWEAKDFVGDTPSYYQFDENNPTALEIIDPGCEFCKKLYNQIKDSKFYERYNVAYLLYPIPDENNDFNDGFKFQASYTLSLYLEALKQFPLENSDRSGDWLLMDKIFTEDGLQNKFNLSYSRDEIPDRIKEILVEIGYTQEEVDQIAKKAESEEIKSALQKQREIVEDEIRTIRIPTIIFDGRRFDRVPDIKYLEE